MPPESDSRKASTNCAACTRSSGRGSDPSEPATSAVTFSDRLQNIECTSGSEKFEPNRFCGRSAAIPQGPSRIASADSRNAPSKLGSSSV